MDYLVEVRPELDVVVVVCVVVCGVGVKCSGLPGRGQVRARCCCCVGGGGGG